MIGGTWEPAAVAASIWSDVLEGAHYATVGLDGWLLGRGTVGMAPETSPERAVQQACPLPYPPLQGLSEDWDKVMLGGVLRMIGLGYLRYFDYIVQRCSRQRQKRQ